VVLVVSFTERQKTVLETLGAPAATVFGLHGIKLKLANGKGYLNVSRCPWCSHGEDSKPNWQCGVREIPGNRGFLHSYKCYHAHDAPTNDSTPHYADVLAALGHIGQEEASWVKNLRADLEQQRQRAAVNHSAAGLKPANKDYNQRLQRRLKANDKAMAWLAVTRGYCSQLIDHFRLGLSEPYTPKDAEAPIHCDALAAPLVGRDGRFYSKYVNYSIPDVTIDSRDKKPKSWSAGPPRTYYSAKAAGHTRLFVCDGLKDLWAIWDQIRGTPLEDEMLLISSTNGGAGFPDEWREPGFWEQWETIYLGHDNDQPNPQSGKMAGDEHAKSIARLAVREMRRVWPIGVKDWNDFFLAKHSLEDFERLLLESHALGLKELGETAHTGQVEGLQAALPVTISGAFHNGCLYEAVDVLEVGKDPETGQPVERYKTIVIRSDGTMHQVRPVPAPKGTPPHQQVYRLYPDGTTVDGPARPSPYCTWRWPSIQAFLDGNAKSKPLAGQLRKIRGHLKSSVWLPFEEDYTLLACTVVATYVQNLFDAVPLILVTGAPGTGKTQLGIAMSELSANSPNSTIGQISAASIARLIDQSRGFVVLDDLESIGTRRNGDAQFDELIQALKLSYNKQSAVKFWTNMKTGKLEKLNFFGIKLINNTRGVDAILGSRMFTIATRRMPDGQSVSREELLSPEQRIELRDDMHVWAFQNAVQVAQAYIAVFPNKTTRSDEIAAPLKVISQLAAYEEVSKSLDRALERQSKMDVAPETPEQILHEAVESILLEAIAVDGTLRTILTVTEVIMRMALLVDTNYGKNFTTEMADIESPEWVGRQLKQRYVQPGAEQKRIQLYGKFLRGYELAGDFIAKTLNKATKSTTDLFPDLKRSVDPRDFCRGCALCLYRTRCEIRPGREARETQGGSVPAVAQHAH
jgi:hypothetical protein